MCLASNMIGLSGMGETIHLDTVSQVQREAVADEYSNSRRNPASSAARRSESAGQRTEKGQAFPARGRTRPAATAAANVARRQWARARPRPGPRLTGKRAATRMGSVARRRRAWSDASAQRGRASRSTRVRLPTAKSPMASALHGQQHRELQTARRGEGQKQWSASNQVRGLQVESEEGTSAVTTHDSV